MRLKSVDGSCVFIDLRATGLLRAIAHNPTLRAAPEPFAIDLSGEGASVDARFAVGRIEVPPDISASDREKMRDNLLGPEVLDSRRFPVISFSGRYAGTLEDGTLTGELKVKTAIRRLTMPIRTSRSGDVVAASGSWDGKLTDIGIKPFKALLGALKLQDSIVLRIEAHLRAEASTG